MTEKPSVWDRRAFDTDKSIKVRSAAGGGTVWAKKAKREVGDRVERSSLNA